MKKLIITIITTFLILTGGDKVFALSATVEFVGPEEALLGEEINVQMYINPTDVPDGIGTLGGFLEFDDTKLQFVRSTNNAASGLTALNNEAIFKYAFVDFSGGTTSPKTRTLIITYTFEVIAGGSTEVTFRELEIGDPNAVVVNGSINSLTTTLTAPSSNNNLASLSVSGQTLDPVFDANTLTYNVSVPYLTTSVNVGATLADSTASLTGTGNKNLSVGNNVTTIRVTAQNGDIKNYTLNITREADTRSSDNKLSSLSIGGQTITPVFNADTLTYNVTVLNSVTSVVVNAVANDSKSSVVVSGNSGFKVGNNTITIKVTAENGSVRNYTINLTRQDIPKDDDTTLGSLNITGHSITPVFNSNTLTYNLTVPYEVSNLDISAVANSSTSTVNITGDKNLTVGSNTVNITVTAENSDTRKYVVNVIREERIVDSNNKLSSLSIDGFDITPTFNSDTYSYSMVVGNEVNDLNVNAIAASAKASVSISGNTGLLVGQNTIVVNVTSESGSVLEYTIVVTKEDLVIVEKDSNNYLKSLEIAGYEINPVFDKNENVYILNVSNDVTSLDISALAESAKAVVEIIGNSDLKEGINSIKVVVTAEDGSVKNYILNVNRREEASTVVKPTLSSDNFLNELLIDGYLIEFDKNLNNYDITVPFEVSSLKLDYTKSSSKSKVEVIGNSEFLINEINSVEVMVTAEDGSLRIYTINVLRSPLSSDNKLKELLVDGSLIRGFNSNITTYDITVAGSVKDIDLNALAYNEDAIITGLGVMELVEGNNTFLISVEDENSFIRYYQINVLKEETTTFFSILPFIALGLSLLSILVILIILLKRKPVVEIAKSNEGQTTIDFKPEFNFNSRNGSDNSLEYGATKKLLNSSDVKEVPFDPYDDIVTKEEIIDAINHKDSETLKMLYEQEMLNRKKDELKKRRDDEWEL